MKWLDSLRKIQYKGDRCALYCNSECWVLFLQKYKVWWFPIQCCISVQGRSMGCPLWSGLRNYIWPDCIASVVMQLPVGVYVLSSIASILVVWNHSRTERSWSENSLLPEIGLYPYRALVTLKTSLSQSLTLSEWSRNWFGLTGFGLGAGKSNVNWSTVGEVTEDGLIGVFSPLPCTSLNWKLPCTEHMSEHPTEYLFPETQGSV